MQVCIDFSTKKGKTTLWLESNRKLKPALSLYEKYAFVETQLNPETPNERCDIRMALTLDGDK